MADRIVLYLGSGGLFLVEALLLLIPPAQRLFYSYFVFSTRPNHP